MKCFKKINSHEVTPQTHHRSSSGTSTEPILLCPTEHQHFPTEPNTLCQGFFQDFISALKTIPLTIGSPSNYRCGYPAPSADELPTSWPIGSNEWDSTPTCLPASPLALECHKAVSSPHICTLCRPVTAPPDTFPSSWSRLLLTNS